MPYFFVRVDAPASGISDFCIKSAYMQGNYDISESNQDDRKYNVTSHQVVRKTNYTKGHFTNDHVHLSNTQYTMHSNVINGNIESNNHM